jgi:hypothetical protein
MDHRMKPEKTRNAPERIAAAIIGTLFTGIAVAILVYSAHDLSVGAVVASVVIGALGIEALFSAARNRRCLISRIGPMP